MSIKQIKSMVTFTRGTVFTWESLNTAIPDGVVAFSIDDGGFRLGDGITLYKDLPILFDYTELVSAQGGLSDIFVEPTSAQNGNIVVVSFDSGTNTVRYAVSNTSLPALLASIAQLETDNTNQDTAIAELMALALSIDVSINTGNDNSLIVVNNRRYTNSGQTLSSIQAYIASEADYVPGSHLEEAIFYTSETKAKIIDKLKLYDNCTYFVDIVGFNNNIENAVFSLSSANTSVTITNISGSLFSITFNNVTNVSKTDTPVVLVASIDDGTGNRLVKKALACLVASNRILATVFGGASTEDCKRVITDSSDNIYAIGNTSSEGSGVSIALIKFDPNLNILIKKCIGGSADDYGLGITIDNFGYIYISGITYSEGLGYNDAFILKFDQNLNLLLKKRVGGDGDDHFTTIAKDKLNNIVVAGFTSTTSLGFYDFLIYKFNSNLEVISKKRFGGVGEDQLYEISIDSYNNIYVVGYTNSESAGGNAAVIIKLDADLNILIKKRFNGTNDNVFSSVVIDKSDNVFAVGTTASEGLGGTEALIIKFDSNLNILAKKRYGGTGDDSFSGASIDSLDNIICVGSTKSEGLGGDAYGDLMVVKFDNNLGFISKKRYGGVATDQFNHVTIDSNDNIIAAGRTFSDGVGLSDGIIFKLPKNVPSGTFVGTVLTGMTCSDITTLTLTDSTLVLAEMTALTTTDVSLTVADISSFSTVPSTLTQKKDIIN